jgi:hypothetical protein
MNTLTSVAGSKGRLHNNELHNLYASPDIIGMIKPRMRWTGHVEPMGRWEMSAEFSL